MVAVPPPSVSFSASLPEGWLVPQWPAPPWVGAVMSSRAGGVSLPPYNSMNLGDHVQDDLAAVADNRQILQGLIQAQPVYLQQVHETDAVYLHADASAANSIRADACYTQASGLACTIQTADCLPVLLCHAESRIVGAAHAGWRSLAGRQGQGVLEVLLQAMHTQCPQAGTAGWLAWLGPCIGPNAFEVGEEVRAAFLQTDAQAANCFAPASDTGKWLADLVGLARQRLAALGVHAVFGNDSSSNWCTFSQPQKYFSYRRDGQTGRMAAAIWLNDAH